MQQRLQVLVRPVLGVQLVGWEPGEEGMWGEVQGLGSTGTQEPSGRRPSGHRPATPHHPSGPPAPVSPGKAAEVPSPRLIRRTGQHCPQWVESPLPLAPCAWDGTQASSLLIS